MFTKKCIINLSLTITQLSKSLISYKIIEKFDYNSDYLSIFL